MRRVGVAVQRACGTVALERLPQPVGELQPHHRAFVAERPVGHLPAAVQRPDQILGGHLDIGQEDLVEVEVVAVVHARERPAGHAGGIGRNQQRADPLVFRCVGIGADEREDDVGVVRTRRPDLLTVDDEVIAVQHRPRGQSRKVGTRARFTHAQRCGDLGAQDGHRPPLLLLVGAERQQRCRDDADALRVERVVDAPPRKLLAVHELLAGCPRCGRRTPAGCPAAASRGRTAVAASAATIPARATSSATARRPPRPRRADARRGRR